MKLAYKDIIIIPEQLFIILFSVLYFPVNPTRATKRFVTSVKRLWL